MKRIKKIIVILVLILFILIYFENYINYNFKIDIFLSENTYKYSINKSDDISNEEFIGILTKNAKKNDIDIIYMTMGLVEDIYSTEIYSTNNTDILKTLTNGEINKTGEFDSLSTYENKKLGYSNNYTNYVFNSFEEISKYNLSKNDYLFYGNEESFDNFLLDISNEGIESKEPNNKTFPKKYNSIFFKIIIFYFIIVFNYLLYEKIKIEHLNKRLSGYTNCQIYFHDNIEYFKVIFKVYFLTLIGMIILILFINIYMLKPFLLYSLPKFFIILIILILIYAMISLLIFKENNIEIIKKKNNNKILLIMTIILKFIIILVLTSSLISGIYNIKNYYETYINQKIISKNMYNYANVLINVRGQQIGEELDKTIDDKTTELINLTYEELDAIIINSRNYQSFNEEATLCQQYNECEIYVNEEYLNTNKINIIENNYKEGALNIILPISQKDIYKEEKIEGIDYKVSYYQDDSKFYLYDPYAQGTNGKAYLENIPVVLVGQNTLYDPLYIGRINLNSYYVKVNVDEPYNSVSKYIDDVDGSDLFKEVNLISNNFMEKLSRLRIYIAKESIILFVSVLIYIIIIYYVIKIYFENNKNEISIYYLNGYNKNFIIKRLLVITIVEYTLLFILFQNIIVLLMFLIEYIIINISFKKLIKKQILKTIQEEQ